MRRTHGTRQGTRSILKRAKSERGRVNIGRIMHNYSEGDLVSIVLDGGQQKGMPHRRFQGMTGTIESKQGRAYVVSFSDKNKKKTVILMTKYIGKKQKIFVHFVFKLELLNLWKFKKDYHF